MIMKLYDNEEMHRIQHRYFIAYSVDSQCNDFTTEQMDKKRVEFKEM